MENNRTRIIIIGRNYTSRLGMIRAVGEMKFDVHIINTSKSHAEQIDAYSKYVKGYHYAVEPDRELLIHVIKSLKSNTIDKDIIIPVDDYAASTIDLNMDCLKADFLFQNCDMIPGQVTHLMNKELQKNLAIKHGMNTTKGWAINVHDGKYEIPSDLSYPVFPKPKISFMGNKRCMKRCNNEEELCEALHYVPKTGDCPILIEQYVEIEKEYAALGYSDGKKVVLPAMIQMLADGSGSHKGVTLQGKIMPPHEFKTFFDKVESMLLDMKFVGLFDIDSYSSDGLIYFNELNLRFGASGYAITASGINLPKVLVQHFCQQKETDISFVEQEAIFVNEKVALQSYLANYISFGAYRHYINNANILFIRNEYDPNPFKQSMHNDFKLVVKRMLKNVLRIK